MLRRDEGAVEFRRSAVGALVAAAHCSADRRWRIRALREADSDVDVKDGQRQCQSPSATSLGAVEDMSKLRRLWICALFVAAFQDPSFDLVLLPMN